MTALKKPKKRPKRNYSHQADQLFSQLVRSGGVCESSRPEHSPRLQCAHGFSRRYRAVRWDRRNAWCLCEKCHQFYTAHPIEWTDWMIERLGAEGYEELRQLALSGERPDFPSLIAFLKEQLQRVGAA